MASPALPELHNTIVVAAFEGWNDAGDAASDALEHLDAIWEADPIVEIDDEAYYDYQVNRPVIRQVDGVTRELVWPAMRISHCRPPGSDRDVVLMHGVEPNMRWRTFCAELVAIADKLNVDTVVILGALLADTPHTRPVPVSGAAYSPESAKRFGLEETRYEGPTGIAGVFQDACVAAGIPAVTFWAAVPHYVSNPPNPKATVALLPGPMPGVSETSAGLATIVTDGLDASTSASRAALAESPCDSPMMLRASKEWASAFGAARRIARLITLVPAPIQTGGMGSKPRPKPEIGEAKESGPSADPAAVAMSGTSSAVPG